MEIGKPLETITIRPEPIEIPEHEETLDPELAPDLEPALVPV